MLKPRFASSPLDHPAEFQDALVAWFGKHGKDYPWRRTHNPYEILVSEVMLQQTQISTVLGKGYYTRFLSVFPTAEKLASADDASLLKAWEGLGYYRRARMLRDSARALIAEHGGCFPHETTALMALPGIGRYTAGALRAFAFGLPAVLVDGNVSRVLSRIMDFSQAVDESPGQRQIWAWAEILADDESPRLYHAALMELGQTICRPGIPDCMACPISRFCKTQHPSELPLKTRKATITSIDEHALWLRDASGRLLLHHEAGKQRTGLWKLPLRTHAELASLPTLTTHRYAITRYHVNLHVYDGTAVETEFPPVPGDSWVEPSAIRSLAMAAPFRRVVEQLL